MSDNSQVPLEEQPFYMLVEQVFVIYGRPVVIVAGRVSTGTLRKGDTVCLSDSESIVDAVIGSFEGFMKDPDSFVAEPGDNISVRLTHVEAQAVKRGMRMSVTKVADG